MIYRYPKGQKLTYSSISTNQFLPYFNGARPEMGEIIMGTDGTIEITVGDDAHPGIAWWYREPPKTTTVEAAAKKNEPFVAGATMVASGGRHGPIPIMTSDLEFNRGRELPGSRSQVRPALAHLQGRAGAGRGGQPGGYGARELLPELPD